MTRETTDAENKCLVSHLTIKYRDSFKTKPSNVQKMNTRGFSYEKEEDEMVKIVSSKPQSGKKNSGGPKGSGKNTELKSSKIRKLA